MHKVRIILLFAFAFFLKPENLVASHMMGADISYECLGGNQYRISLNIYRDCNGISVSSNYDVTVSSASCGITQTLTLNQAASTGIEVSPLCAAQISQSTCNGGTLPGVQQYLYQATITLPQQCNDWTIATTDIDFCCRNSSITNLSSPSSQDLYIRATLNNTNGLCNNAPFFTTLPVPYICNGQLINYNHGTVDIDGDSLVYTLVNPLTTNGANIGYTGGYTPTNPFGVSGSFQFNSQTGQMTFTPSGLQVAVVTVLVQEYRNGVLIGSVMRDIQVVILNCSNSLPQSSTPVPGSISGGQYVNGRFEVCPGDALSFQFNITDPNPNDVLTVTDNLSVSIPGATSSYTNGAGNSMIGSFSWTPTASDTGLRVFTVTVRDNACPTIGINTFSYSIYVLSGTTAGPDQVYCSAAGPIQLNAAGGTQFTWSPPTGLSCTNCPNPIATPTVTTTYIVQSNLSSQCKNRDTITIRIAPNFTLDAGPNASICLNALHQMSPTIDQSGAPYTYVWSPSAGLSSTSILNPFASPSTSTTYRLRVTSAQGCTLQDSVRITISGVAPSVTAYADPDTVCPGGYSQLSVSVTPRNCGLALSPCLNGNTNYTLGSATTTTTDGTPYDGFWHDGRVQILYRATELTALGLSAGTINTLSWNIATKGSSIPYNGFTIKMGCTSLNTLASPFIPGLSVVMGPVTYTTTLGWNTHTLTTGYEWDGISNLIVEICYDNTAYTQADAVQQTPAGYNAVLYRNVDNNVGCNLTAPTATGTRPNTRFGFCTQTLNGATINWTSPATATILSPSSDQTSARVFGTTPFVVSVTQGGCTGQALVNVITDTSVYITAGPDTALCSSMPVQLFSNAVGTPGPIQLTCGTNARPCTAGGATTYSIGNNGGVTTSTTPFRGQEQEARMQILIRQNELSAAGLTAGILRSIAFNVSSKNSTVSFNQFTIRIGCTNQTTVSTAFSSGLSEVFSPKPVNTIVGWNTLSFDNTYDWDGLSNLLIEICFTNTGNNNNDIITYTQTGFNSVVYDAGSFLFMGGCNLNVAPAVSNFRPDIRISACPPPPGTFVYTWTPGVGLNNASIQNPIANPSSTTTYVVSVTDGTCIASDSVTIRLYNGYLSNISGNNVGCSGASDGNLVSTPSGGVAPYTFNWSTGRNYTGITDTVFNLTAGTYSLTLTDANGCNQTDTYTLTVPPALSFSITSTNISCFGYNDGTATTSTTGGTPPYSYLWSNGETTSGITNAIPANYMVTLTDASGCTQTASANITEPGGITFTTSSTIVSCFQGSDGTATVNITGGGTPPFVINWGNGFQQSNVTTSINTGLSAGYISFAISDNSSCIRQDSVLVSERDSFTITAFSLQDASCFNTADGIAVANVSGDTVNYQFLWTTTPTDNNALADSRPQGINNLEVTDTAGCTQFAAVIINSPPQIILRTEVTDATCFGGCDGSSVITISAGGVAPFSFNWNNGNNTATIYDLCASTYYLTVTDNNSCEEYDTVVISQPDSFSYSISTKNVSCFGGTDGEININVSGGTGTYNYSWADIAGTILANNSNQLTDIPVGNYLITVTDSLGCSDTINNLIVAEPSLLQVSYSIINESCPGSNDGTITVNAAGGTAPYGFSLSSNTPPVSNPVFTGLSPGNYSAFVTDSNNCIVDTAFTVVPADSFSLIFNPDSVNIALGEETILVSTIIPSNDSGYVYNWEPQTGLSCSTCPSPNASPTITTVYQLTVTNPDGCSVTEQITVAVDNNQILFVPNAFTPDGDGINDLLKVFGISVKTINFNIFNRWGEKVYGVENGDINSSGWDGTYFGKPLPPDVFVYYLDAEFDDGQRKQLKGSISLLR
jgi:gliding motility-associated-like protein